MMAMSPAFPDNIRESVKAECIQAREDRMKEISHRKKRRSEKDEAIYRRLDTGRF
jgi:hypothetical protein